MAELLRGRRLPSGIRLEDALHVSRDFLEFLKEHIEENEPGAFRSIRIIENVLEEFPDDIDDLGKTAEELDAELDRMKANDERAGE